MYIGESGSLAEGVRDWVCLAVCCRGMGVGLWADNVERHSVPSSGADAGRWAEVPSGTWKGGRLGMYGEVVGGGEVQRTRYCQLWTMDWK